jgi:hypothetical protein
MEDRAELTPRYATWHQSHNSALCSLALSHNSALSTIALSQHILSNISKNCAIKKFVILSL